MATKKLKLFVWSDFCPDYSGGLAVVIAHDETEARKRIVSKIGFTPSDWGTLEILRLDRRMVAAVTGGS